MKKGEYLDTLLRSPKTVFSTKDIALLWREENNANMRARLHYAVAHSQLIRLRRGLYAKSQDYNSFELAVKLNTPSYISFETVLAKAGVIFQYYDSIFVASYLSRSITCDHKEYIFRRIAPDILTNPIGLNHDKEYAIATTERALLDILYLNKEYHFDNLSEIKWDTVFDLLKIYDNKRLVLTIDKLYKEVMSD